LGNQLSELAKWVIELGAKWVYGGVKLACNGWGSWALGLMSLLVLARPCGGQEEVSGDRRVMTFFSAEVNLRALREDSRLAVLPWEVASSLVSDIVGFDVIQEEKLRVSLSITDEDDMLAAISFPNSGSRHKHQLSPARFMEVREPAILADLKAKRFSDSDWIVIQRENVFLFGESDAQIAFAERNLQASADFDLSTNETDVVKIRMTVMPIRLIWMNIIYENAEDLAEDHTNAIVALLEDIEEMQLDISLTDPISIQYTLKCRLAEQVDFIQALVNKVRLKSVLQLESFVQSKIDSWRLSQREAFAWRAYVARLKEEVLNLKPQVTENELRYEIGSLIKMPLAAVMSSGILETLEMVRLTNERFSSQYKLRELSGAIEKFNQDKKQFPLREILGEDGESLLSWRVRILPYLGYETLYHKFHLHERWDSPHNIQLLAEMPSILRNGPDGMETGRTTFVAPYGGSTPDRQTIWDIVPGDLREIPEEQRESILLVEVNEEAAVPWTSPEDFNIESFDLRTFLRSPPAGNGVVFVDGQTEYLSNAIGLEDLRELLQCSKRTFQDSVP
jgi:hypothetical protein